MRIIGNIAHPNLKITVFKNDGRVSVQFESGLYTQIYKFRDGEGVDDLRAVEQLIDAAFVQKVLHLMQQMHALRQDAFALTSPPSAYEFDVIV